MCVLLGGSGRNLIRRKRLAQRLKQKGIGAVIPEEDFPVEAPSVMGPAILRKADVDLVIIYPESLGSATEYGEFSGDTRIAPKLRVLVPNDYHPLYGMRRSYLTDKHLSHLAVWGHVYAFDDTGRSNFPSSIDTVVKLVTRYRKIKAQRKKYDGLSDKDFYTSPRSCHIGRNEIAGRRKNEGRAGDVPCVGK